MTTETAIKKRFKPYQLSIAFGVGIGTFTMTSGIIPQLTGLEKHSLIHREVFGGIPTALVVAFYTVIPMMLIWGRCDSLTEFATGNAAHQIVARQHQKC